MKNNTITYLNPFPNSSSFKSPKKVEKPCYVVDLDHLELYKSQFDVFRYLTSLQLCGQCISEIDVAFLSQFRCLESLDLTGNDLQTIPSGSLPTTLKHLNLSTNKFSIFPNLASLDQLIHLNLGYNKITSLPDPILSVLPIHLRSLDLTFNLLESLHCITLLLPLKKLKLCSLMGNPIFLSPKYMSLVMSLFPELLIDGSLEPLKANPFLQLSSSPENTKLSIFFGTLSGLLEEPLNPTFKSSSTFSKEDVSKPESVYMYSLSFFGLETSRLRLNDNKIICFNQLVSTTFVPDMTFRNQLAAPLHVVLKRHLMRNEVKQLPSSPGKTKKKKPTEHIIQVCAETIDLLSMQLDLSPFLYDKGCLLFQLQSDSVQTTRCELACILNDFQDQFTTESLISEFQKSTFESPSTFISIPLTTNTVSHNKKGV